MIAFPSARAGCGHALAIALILSGCNGETRAPVALPPPDALAESRSPLSASYVLDGRSITLRNGMHAEPSAPGSASLNSTTAMEAAPRADLDGDGLEDAVVILINTPGGSGTFHYIAVAYNEGSGFAGSTAVLLGDRIELHEITVDQGIVTARYSDRGPQEPMTSAGRQMIRRFSAARPQLRELSPDQTVRQPGSPSPGITREERVSILPAPR